MVFGIFKKKKKEENEKKVAKKLAKTAKRESGEKESLKTREAKEPVVMPDVSPRQTKKKRTTAAPFILKYAHIAEKPSRLAELNQYVFKVAPAANKTEIKKAVEEIYGVDVLKVNIIKKPKKRRRIGRTVGWEVGFKKAVVTIKKGQIIELLPR